MLGLNKKIFWRYFPWFILILALFLLHSRYEINSDEGVILNAAWNISNGRILYINNFEFIPPGAPYLLVWWWKLTGISLLTAAALGFFTSLAGTIGIYFLGLQLELRRWRYLPPALFIVSSAFWPLLNHNAFNLVAIIWATYFLFRGFEKNQWQNFLASGLLTGVSILFLQHKGVAAFTCFSLIIFWQYLKKQSSLKSILLFFSAAIIPVIVILAHWPLNLLYQDLIVFPLTHYPNTNFLPPTLWVGCFAGALFATQLALLNLKNKSKLKVAVLTLLGSSLLLVSLQRADGAHVIASLAPFFIIVALVFEACLRKKLDFIVAAVCFISGLVVLSPWPIFDISATMIGREIKRLCPEPTNIYSGPFMPGIYFEMRALNKTPYSILITNQQTKTQFVEAAKVLEKNPPRCAILNYATVEKFNYTKENPVDEFIWGNYSLVGSIGNVQILVRKK